MEYDKKGDIKYFLIIAIPVVLIGIIISLIYIYTQVPEDHPIRKIAEGLKDIVIGGDDGGNEPPAPDYDYSVSPGGGGGGGGGGAGGGGSSGSGTETPQNCDKEILSFGMVEPSEEISCLDYNGEICIEKEVKCSIRIENSDNKPGYFPAVIDILAEGFSIAQYSETFYILSKESVIFYYNTIVSSSGAEDPANLPLRCSFNTREPPYACK